MLAIFCRVSASLEFYIVKTSPLLKNNRIKLDLFLHFKDDWLFVLDVLVCYCADVNRKVGTTLII
jgi:hypothetical protein